MQTSALFTAFYKKGPLQHPVVCQSTENCTTTEKGGQGTASPRPRAKGHEWRSRLPFISQVPTGKLFFLFKMRKGCLWPTQMSQGWKCTTCSLLLYPIPKPLAKPRGWSVPWHKPGVGRGILQAEAFSGSEDQWMLKLGPSRKKTIISVIKMSCLSDRGTWERSSQLSYQRHYRYNPTTSGAQLARRDIAVKEVFT